MVMVVTVRGDVKRYVCEPLHCTGSEIDRVGKFAKFDHTSRAYENHPERFLHYFLYKKLQISSDAGKFLVLINIFSNSLPTPTPKYMLQMLLLVKACIRRVSMLKFRVVLTFWKNLTPDLSLAALVKNCSYKIKECMKMLWSVQIKALKPTTPFFISNNTIFGRLILIFGVAISFLWR